MKDVWNALADATRREILTLLQKHDMTAGEIVACFSVSGATISHHLKILREANLILAQKEKQTITYRLNTTVFQDFLKQIAEVFGQSPKEETYYETEQN